MEASTSSSSLSNITTPPRLHRANRPLQLPTVCVNDDIGQQQQNLNNNFTAAVVAAISAAAAASPLTSPVFINTEITPSTSSASISTTTPLHQHLQTFHGVTTPHQHHHHQQQQQAVAATQAQQFQDLHAFRLASGGATSAMLHERWFSDYRHERTSSSSSDSGIIFQFSPPGGAHLGPCPSSASLSISPPGLSPLQLDSAFSTPTPSSSNRFRTHFTFDHVMSPVRRKTDSTSSAFDLSSSVIAAAAAAAAAANLQQQQQQTSAAVLNEIMKRASTASTSSSSGIGTSSSMSTTDFEEEYKRKHEEFVAAANATVTNNSLFQPPIKSPVFRTESLPAVRFPLQSEVEKMMQTFYSNQPQQPQFLQRSPVVRTSSLNVSSPPFFQSLNQQQQLRPTFGSAQSAFRAPSTFAIPQPASTTNSNSTSTLPPPPTILKTAPSPPQKQRKKTSKSSTSPVPEETDETKRQYFCTTCNKDFRRPDILSRCSTEIKAEILETDPEEEDEDDEIIDVTNIEDDVVIDDQEENVEVSKFDNSSNDKNDRVLEL
uniref:Uncharacterized protein n=1 Tax=Panagrolaimus sp. ES5 TaxID=591445 RepID=A0AC34G5G6_9BILA